MPGISDYFDPADRGIRGFHIVPDAERDRDPNAAPPPIDFAPVRALGHQLVRWVLDTASSRTSDPEDLAAIKRVRRTIERRQRGAAAQLAEADLLTVAGVLIATIERECAVPGVSHFVGALYAHTGEPALARVLSQLTPEGVVPKVARASGRPFPISVRYRPCVAHAMDDAGNDHDDDEDTDVGPTAFLTFR